MTAALWRDPIVQFFAFAVLGLILSRLVLRGHPVWRLIANITFLIVLTTLLLYNGIEPYAPDTHAGDMSRRIFVGFAKAVWWIGGAMVLISSVRLFLIFERKPREARLLQDLVVGLIYLGTALSVIAYVFSVPVGTLIATSGVFAIILGLALQSTLADVFSGIALNLGRPYSVGDWIVLDSGVEGRVIETNWRATHLLSGTNDLIAIPNSQLAKANLTNLSSPDESHGISIKIRVAPAPPATIEEVMRTVLFSSNNILKSPSPSVTIKGLDGQAVEVELSCRVRNMAQMPIATNEIYDLIFRHCKAAGLPLAVPATSGVSQEQDAAYLQHPSTAWRLLNAVPLFSPLTEDEKETLAASMTRQTYRKDAIIAEQGSRLMSLMLIRNGVVAISRKEGDREIELMRLSPGDCFGEEGMLTGSPSPGSVKALTFVVAYEIKPERLATLMHERPALADELGLILSRRVEAERLQTMEPLSRGEQAATFAARIRKIFQLS
ncbi:small-conductance mechanosensitive channel/CRP-like cAMP-binding protein [Rhizobium mesoamericanum]|uniref:mechanosensitive ion channel family protein n=1 Tax=Rhizobium mesoamericanum TaxID=1079800 RepID=UPI0027878140|nr:mechanosensitive ion channel family protein [Rhizobium mesoamericanum]MDQ0563758.1 small-conductance mechanosensitive channel/CRP-like cAMP-binding protein [Rhizobium mesoamericanum]